MIDNDLRAEKLESLREDEQSEKAFNLKISEDQDFAVEHVIEAFEIIEKMEEAVALLAEYGYDFSVAKLSQEIQDNY